MATDNHPNDHVSLSRAEYDAFIAGQENYQKLVAQHEQTRLLNAEMATTIDMQAQRLSLVGSSVKHLERVTNLQSLYIDLLRDGTKVAPMEEMSEFWRQWIIHTNKPENAREGVREAVAKYEPDLFRKWREWVNNEGRGEHVFGNGTTRAEYEASQPRGPQEMQALMVARLRSDNAKKETRIAQLEAEIAALKTSKEKKA